LNPFSGATVIVLVPPARCGKIKLLGDAESVKFGPGVIVTETVVLLIKPPAIPVTVTGNVPVAAVLLAARVIVLDDVAGFGLNDALTPPGRPEADKLTLLLNPFSGATVIVPVPPAPC